MPEDKSTALPSRPRLQGILDGQDPVLGRFVALALHGLIVAAAIAFALSTMPELSETGRQILSGFEMVAVAIFATEYLLRLYAAPHPLHYALSFWGIVDLLAWAPVVLLSFGGATTVRLLRLVLVVRLLKIIRYNNALRRLGRAFVSVRDELLLFYMIAFFLVYISAVGIYFFENTSQPDVFRSVPASLWRATITLTTVGYGDALPITMGGKIFTTVILFMGMGIFAVPAGVITSALIGRDIEDIEESLEKIETSEEKARKKQRPLPKRGG